MTAISVPTNPLKSVKMRRLTRRVLQLRTREVESRVHLAVRLGHALQEGRDLLQGHDGPWLHQIGLHRLRAGSLRALAQFARDEPRQFRQWTALGVIRLTRLARLTAVARRRLLLERDRARLLRMGHRRFRRMTMVMLTRTQKVTPEVRAMGLTRQLRRLLDFVQEPIFPAVRNDSIRASLRDSIDSVVRRLLILRRRLGATRALASS